MTVWDTGEAVGEAKVLRLRLGLQPLRLLPLRLEGVLLVLGELRRVRGRGRSARDAVRVGGEFALALRLEPG